MMRESLHDLAREFFIEIHAQRHSAREAHVKGRRRIAQSRGNNSATYLGRRTCNLARADHICANQTHRAVLLD